MRIQSDVMLRTMAEEGETVEAYLQRLRDMHLAALDAKHRAEAALAKARGDLYETSRRGAHPDEYREVHATVMHASRVLGTAKYEADFIEFTLSEVYHRVNR